MSQPDKKKGRWIDTTPEDDDRSKRFVDDLSDLRAFWTKEVPAPAPEENAKAKKPRKTSRKK